VSDRKRAWRTASTRSGGQLRIRSAPGRGTTVAGTVPLTTGASRSTSGPVPVVEPSGA